MRVAAVHLPSIRIELARARLPEPERRAPLAVVVARPGGTVKDERTLLGGTRLDAVSHEARACGVRAGQTIAAARAREASLVVRVVAEPEVQGVLASVAEAALAFGKTTAIDPARDTVCVDVTGCAHLFGGEEALATTLRERVRAMHHAARVAVADGPRVAKALARHARSPAVVASGENAAAVRALPLSALPLDPRARAWLEKLGLSRVGDVQTLPAKGLAARMGGAHVELLALLAGDDDGTLLDPYVPPDVPEERAELEYGIELTEPLVFVAKTLCDRLAARLAGRAMAASRIELELKLDQGIARESAVPARAALALALPAPLATASELLAVVRARVESFAIPAPILAVTLRAPELARKESRALDLFVPEAKADRALPRLVAELAADLGPDRVGTLALVNTWIPESRTALVACGVRAATLPGVALEGAGAVEPSRVLSSPIDARGLAPVRLLARIAAVEWWRVSAQLAARDYVAAWDAENARMGWVAIDHASGEVLVRGWMD